MIRCMADPSATRLPIELPAAVCLFDRLLPDLGSGLGQYSANGFRMRFPQGCFDRLDRASKRSAYLGLRSFSLWTGWMMFQCPVKVDVMSMLTTTTLQSTVGLLAASWLLMCHIKSPTLVRCSTTVCSRSKRSSQSSSQTVVSPLSLKN